MTKEQQARELAALGRKKAHIEAVRRIQLVFEQELKDAGIKGADVQTALTSLNAAIGFYEDSVGGQFDNALFEMTYGE